jgi:polysaccharide chain length determinant protein (PEP-CTERM system associated)
MAEPVESFEDEFEERGGGFSWTRLQHLLYAPLRRPWLVAGPFAVILAISVAALFVLPKKYRSATLILVESEKVPTSFVPKMATGESERRLDNIRAQVLSRTRLEQVLRETNPFPELGAGTRAVDAMRRSTTVSASGNDGFTIEFVHEQPRIAQQVTDRLATLFIDETVKARGQQVEDAVDFLVTQVNDARRELESKDTAVRLFKEQRMGRLPEQLDSNLANLQMLQRELQSVEDSLLFARERQESLTRGLGRPGSAPAAGGGQPSAGDGLTELRSQLASMRSRYTEEHPDVQALRTRIARMEARLAQAAAAAGEDAGSVEDPLLAERRQQLQTARAEVAKFEARRGEIEGRISVLRGRVEETPRTEQELATLLRDYDKLKENYTALLSKQLEAQMAGRLEQRWKGDQFRVLDPANLPERPYFPRRSLIVGLGALLGLLAGLALSVVLEILDPTVKDAEELIAMLPHPVLARIPHLPSLDQAGSR